MLLMPMRGKDDGYVERELAGGFRSLSSMMPDKPSRRARYVDSRRGVALGDRETARHEPRDEMIPKSPIPIKQGSNRSCEARRQFRRGVQSSAPRLPLLPLASPS